MNRKLVKKLDKIFSEFIRKREADENGITSCVTCGRRDHWKNMDAGHFIGRQHMGTRWDERNVHPQCKRCNGFEGGQQYHYGHFLKIKYGDQIIDELEYKGRAITKFNDRDGELMIKLYTGKVLTTK